MKLFLFLRKNYARQRLNDFIAEHATEAKTLDVGCRNSPYAHLFPNRTGVDVNPGTGVDVVCSVYDLLFESESFECVLCTEVLEHLSQPQKAIDEMRRVLAPSGTLILTTRFLYPRHGEPNDYFRYTPEGLQYLLEDFHIVSIKPETEGIRALAVLLQSYALEQDPSVSFRWGRVGRTLILLAAWVCAHIGSVTSRETVGNTHTQASSVLASGYYIIARKK